MPKSKLDRFVTLEWKVLHDWKPDPALEQALWSTVCRWMDNHPSYYAQQYETIIRKTLRTMASSEYAFGSNNDGKVRRILDADH